MAHPHAENMRLYAEDAAETETPWNRWESASTKCCPGLGWVPCIEHPNWLTDMRYRRKPRTIRIGAHEVPEPVREPLSRQDTYFLASLSAVGFLATEVRWYGDSSDTRWLRRGLIHRTREAAEAHARALIAISGGEV